MRSVTLVPDIALYLLARSPQPQQNECFAFVFVLGHYTGCKTSLLILMPKFEVHGGVLADIAVGI